jgi:hypothetical protein
MGRVNPLKEEKMTRSESLVSSLVMVVLLGLLSSVPSGGAASGIGWGAAQIIEFDSLGNAQMPQVSASNNGDAVVVWLQHDGIRYNVWSNRYVAGIGWEVPQLIEDDNLGGATESDVSVDGSGNAIAVWSQFDGTRYNIWSNRYVVGIGWGNAQLIETNDLGGATYPDVSADSSGNAIAVWQQWDGVRQNIWSNRYVSGVGWLTAQLIETDNSGDAAVPRVSVDRNGNAIVVWYQLDGVRYNIWSNRYVAGLGWETAMLIETNNLGNAYNSRVSVHSSGNATAVWDQSDGLRYNIWSSRYVVGTGWGAPQLIESENMGNARAPEVSLDGLGNAVAVWYQSDGTRNNVHSNRYVVGTGWGTAQLIETDNTGNVNQPEVSVDGVGNAIAVWYQYDGTRWNIWSNRYVVGTGWGSAQRIETDNSGDAEYPTVSMDGLGNAIAVWYQYDGLRTSIWSNRYVKPDTTPPSLSLTAPSQDVTTQEPIVTVTGTTEPGVTLKVNGVLVAVEANGFFSCELALAHGTNTILVNATDAGGNSVTISRTVRYLDPVPDLRQDLNATQDELNATQDDLDAAEDEVERTKSDIENLKSQSFMLMGLLAAFVVLAAVMCVLYFRLRSRVAGMTGVKIEKAPPPPPQI